MTVQTLVPPSADPIAVKGYAFGSAGYAWLVVTILSGLQLVSNMERQILSLTVEPLSRDFHIQDIDVSLLQGLAFALFYALVAIPIGWLADRWRRDRIITIGTALWVVATVASMMAKSYSALFAARLLTGLADASLLPAAFSLLSDYFPKAKLAGALGTVTGASFLGTGASLVFGGLLLKLLPMNGDVVLPLFGAVHGWQLSFGIMGLPGVALLAALFAVREPPRRPGEQEDGAGNGTSMIAFARYTIANRGYLGTLLGGIILLVTYQYGLTNWAVSLFVRKFGWTATQIGLVYGLYFMIIGALASIMGGKLCDHLRDNGRRDANFLIPLVASAVTFPLGLVLALSGSATVAAIALGGITFCVVIAIGPAMAAIPAFVPNIMRAQFVAVTMMLSTLVGAGGGPWLVAFFTEAVFHNPLALPYSLAITASLLLLPAATCFYFGARVARRL